MKAYLILLPVLIGLLCCRISADEPVRMVLQWEHQAQFAGYYMALDKGFYKDANLDVTLLSGGADVDPFQLLLTGQADFCSAMLSSALDFYEKKQGDLVLLAQVVNRSNLALVAWKNGRSGDQIIEKPADLNNSRITIWDAFHLPYRSFLDQHKISAEILPQYYTFSLFLRKGVDACSAMLYNEVHSIRQCHIPADELTVFNFYDLGVNIPEDGIYSTRGTWEARPQVSAAFARASMKGWEYARQNPDEALDAVMRRIDEEKLPVNRAHMNWMLHTILASIYPENESAWTPGVLDESRYNDALRLLGIKANAVNYAEFTTAGARNGLD